MGKHIVDIVDGEYHVDMYDSGSSDTLTATISSKLYERILNQFYDEFDEKSALIINDRWAVHVLDYNYFDDCNKEFISFKD